MLVLSRELEKIISKLDLIKNNYLILTTNLTMESVKKLEYAGIEYITSSNFIWTDESYKSIKQV
jgi:molybdenum cofactor biosynthesis enzyme MoaA